MKWMISMSLLVLMSSCDQSGGGNSSSSGAVPSASISMNEVKTAEIAKINNSLNQAEQYKLTPEDLKSLTEEGALTEEDKAELASLFQ